MSLLRRFGATASSWLRRPKNRYKSLRTRIFLFPLALFGFSFLMIFLLFNLSLHYFVTNEAKSSLQEKIDYLDAAYLYQEKFFGQEAQLFETSYLIFDSKGNLRYQAELLDLETDELADLQTDYKELQDKKASFSHEINLDDSHYQVRKVTYQGLFDQGLIRQNYSDQSGQFEVYVLADISQIEGWEEGLNKLMLALVCLIATIMSLIFFLTSRRLNHTFLSLETYIGDLVEKKELAPPADLSYREFDQLAAWVHGLGLQLAAQEKSQQSFFQNASHELRTPLMSIKGYAEAIEQDIGDSHQSAKIIGQEADKMSLLVEEILTLSSLEAKGLDLRAERFDLVAALYDLTWSLKGQADRRGLVLEHDFTCKHLDIQADENLLMRAISNVLTNALRYAQTRIKLSLDLKGDSLYLSIGNDGSALSQEEQEHIFERFYKGESGGFGIGLSMSQEIIKQHSGKLSLTSEEAWTSFDFEMPLS